MRILLSSLQVGFESSKGHLHPAIEIALALKTRGHDVTLLPLPCHVNEEDSVTLQEYQIEVMMPPALPAHLPFSKEKLESLARDPDTTHLAYESFLISPLEYQFDGVLQLLKEFNPDIVIYDLLVYAAPLAARKLAIKDIGFCAGLKLIAPDTLTKIYQTIAKKLAPSLSRFLKKMDMQVDFHHLELLSTTKQMVFTSDQLIATTKENNFPQGTLLLGPLPINEKRIDVTLPTHLLEKAKNAVVLSFGSVYDPGSFPDLTNIIIKVATHFNLHLFIVSKTLRHLNTDKITVRSYLPLPLLIQHAAVFIHHGGANTFYESFALGARQILIPLATDQPIQAELLRKSKAGMSFYPHEVTETNLTAAFTRLLDTEDVVHQYISQYRKLFADGKGAQNAALLVEALVHEVNDDMIS